MSPILKSRKYSNIPGDGRLELTAPATDTGGTTWPVGTVYQPQSAGRNNLTNRSEQRVSVKGRVIVFAA